LRFFGVILGGFFIANPGLKRKKNCRSFFSISGQKTILHYCPFKLLIYAGAMRERRVQFPLPNQVTNGPDSPEGTVYVWYQYLFNALY
jgi:hypothetical protein